MPLRFELSGNKMRLPQVALATFAIYAAMAAEQKNYNAGEARSDTGPANIHYHREYDASKVLSPTSLVLHARKRKDHKHHHLTPAQIAHKEVTPQEFREWSKVNQCEEGGNWHVSGPEYSGGLGISHENWIHYGGDFFSHSEAAATPDEQIVVAMRIQKDPPDQNGCTGSW